MPGPWRRRSAYSSGYRANPYRRQANWITQTQACQQFGLKPADLEALTPFEVVANPHGGRNPMKKYYLSQVEFLSAQLKFQKNLDVEIVRSRAIERYDLTPALMDTLVPIKTKPNPHNPGTEMRFYSVKDVEKLAERVKKESEAAAAKYAASQPVASSSNATAGPSQYAAPGSSQPSHATQAPKSSYLPASSQTQPSSSQLTGEDSEDEYGDGGFDDDTLASIPLP
ncbi:hypothetical protein PsYK624_082180 [Phanerochaete sordida]|uniref:Uncharacterized protein n=1 Tax=Phanerochaete sordida TaxID=48140 RepID=A0A9P3LEA6_9APHY|nr:hypothetical protein PsYK624_082180 [Phanerochaete sordida]